MAALRSRASAALILAGRSVASYAAGDPATTRVELINEAIAGWRCWAQGFGDFDDADHPAQAALRALDRWRAEQPATR